MTLARTAPALAALALLAGCATPRRATLPPEPVAPPVVQVAPPADRSVRATTLPGRGMPSSAPATRIAVDPPAGDVSLNFPGVAAGEVAKAVLGGILGLSYSVDPDAQAEVTLVTARPVSRAAVLSLFEEALKAANLALVPQPGGYRVMTADAARTAAPLTEADPAPGFARETIRLQFVGAEQLRKLIDPIQPGVVQSADPASNTLVIAGTSGQRQSARDLVRQFDVNWLRGVSFGLFVPQRTDARLIVPELDKVLNAPDAPTRGLIRLIALERLNGIVAVTGQPQYLEDARRWIEILDREGESAEPRLFVYRVQNGRAIDLAAVLSTAFGGGGRTPQRASPADAIGTGRQFGDAGGRGGNPAFGGAQGGFGQTGGGQAGAAGQAGGLGFGGAIAGGTIGAAVGQANLASAQSRLANPVLGQQGVAGAGGATILGATITADETNNAVLVFGTPRAYATIEDALRQLDVPPAQVLIEASVSEVSLNDELRYGLQSLFETRTGDVTLTDFAGPNPITGPPFTTAPQLVRNLPGFSFLYSSSGITTILSALEGLTRVNVLSSPKLMVINNQTASLQVGNQVPITVATNVGGLGNIAGITNQIEYRDTGVILKITPRVNAGGLVLLDIAQEVSDVLPLQTAGNTAAQQTSPTFSTRRIATSIAVEDGRTIALGGLISDSVTRGRTGIPFLSRIPIIGGVLFGRTNDLTRRTELLILLRPRVVRSANEGRAMTEELLAKMRTARGLLPDEPPPPEPRRRGRRR